MLLVILALVFLNLSNKGGVVLKWGEFGNSTERLQKLKIQFTVDSVLYQSPILQKDYLGFRTALGFKESQGKYHRVNSFGYLGKYQFGKSTLSLIGIYDVENFMSSPQLQEEALYAYLARNKWVLRKEIERYEGQIIDGVEVTESGILAAAHLAGPNGVKRFFRSGGTSDSGDAFGTTIKQYLRRFAHYDLSNVEADRNAKVSQHLASEADA